MSDLQFANVVAGDAVRNGMNPLVAGVRSFALSNYERDGWDYVVETYSDADIIERIGRSRTVQGAIAKVRKAIKDMSEYRDDIQATAW